MTTSFKLPTSVIANGAGVNGWTQPNNILLFDDKYAVSAGSTNVLEVGNFNLNIPQGSDITNFTVQVKGYRGSFNTTLQIYAVDTTSGTELSYPMAPFQGFSGTNTLYNLPSTLFGTTWTVDQSNNIKLRFIADGELHLDACLIDADYVAEVTPVTPSPSSGLAVVDEFVEALPFTLAASMTSSDLVMFLQSFNLPDGTEIQFADFHGEADLVIDQGVPGLEESVTITNVEHDYQGSGLVRISFGSINNRGLKFIYPYDHDLTLCVAHTASAQCVISNSARFYSRFLRKNQIGALVSAPVFASNQGTLLADPMTELAVTGAGASIVNDGTNSGKKILNVPGNGVNPPNVVYTSNATSGASQVPSISWNHVSSGLNRLLVVQVETEAASTVSTITYNGLSLAQAVSSTNGSVRNEQWYLVAPPVGTYTIVVTASPSAYLTCGAETLNTVNQSSPIGVTQTSTGTSTSPSLVITTGTDNSIVVDSVATGTLPIVYTVGSGQSVNWSVTANPNARQGASSSEPSGSQPDAVTMSWAITQSVPWAMNAIEVKGIPAVVPPSAGIASINGDTTAAQVIAAGSGITVVSAGGTTTVSATGSSGAVKFGGTGADGAISVSSGVHTVDAVGSSYLELNYSSISVTGTGSVKFVNPHANGTVVVVKCSGNAVLTSSAVCIDASGMGGAGGAAVNANIGGTGPATVYGNDGTNGKSYGFVETNLGRGIVGGAGGASGTFGFMGGITALKEIVGKYPKMFVGAGAGSGSASGANATFNVTSGAGGNGGGCLIVEIAGSINFTTAGGISAAGSDGATGTITTGSITCAGGGAGGGGGSAFVFYNTLVAFSGSVNVSGGAGAARVTAGGGTGQGGGGGGSATDAGANQSGSGNGGNGGNGLSVSGINTEFA